MMFHSQGASKHSCSLLAVTCGKTSQKQDVSEDQQGYPFPDMVSSGRLEVQVLTKPSTAEFHETLESFRPDFVYLQGEQLQNDEEIGTLVWGNVDLSDPETIAGLFESLLPSTVYLEIPNGEKLAEALHLKGIPYVIYWKNAFSCYAACHFRHALFSVLQSHKVTGKFGPHLLGDAPLINVTPPETDAGEDDESSGTLPAIKIYDDDVTIRFLVCGVSCAMDACLLGSLEDGLNALLNIEIRGSKLHNRVSAPPPPLQAGTFSRGVVTMRCDLSTCSSTYISLLVSGSAQTCFDDQILENHVKNEIVDKSQLVQALSNCDEDKLPLSEPRKSTSVACGSTVFEVSMKVPAWASQVLRQLAPDVSYRSFVALGIASIHGLAVASFEKDDADRLLFFCTREGKDVPPNKSSLGSLPCWLRPPVPSRKGSELCQDKSLGAHNSLVHGNEAIVPRIERENKRIGLMNGVVMDLVPAEKKFKVAAMRPVPRNRHHKMLPFSGVSEADGVNGGHAKANLSVVSSTKHTVAGLAPVARRKTFSSSVQAKQIVSLNPLPLKKHGCGRSPIQYCSEEEFLKDVMQFLILRGHTRLIPQGGLAEFPDAILNAKRLDLYNLYREVVSRGGFHVGNGINWKGQVFSKMRNYTATNRMTGVGNTLKRHYETYLLEYELAHDDVDGECCLLCHSSAAGDWVNCGICGEWAHFGCDRRQGLGAFKDYAKTDGLEYICPHCSNTNFKKKPQKTAQGFSQGLALSRPL
ncbi:AT-rich interactive domain-containing protein 4 isoform X2 [Malania oleifera]|uniref:AT-rich interactive domain-containing protein 4 isoform X2 n=1 Tax=Malania oleifera TaxID=397392 RepID=UPI0025ADCBD2|nr:AT-rich interactive domain-containing protein 4 isoform X2 [Malania oleifera]